MDRLKDKKFAEFYKKYLFEIAKKGIDIKKEAKENIKSTFGMLIEIELAVLPGFLGMCVLNLILHKWTIKEAFVIFLIVSALFFIIDFIVFKKSYRDIIKRHIFPEILKIFGNIKRSEYAFDDNIGKNELMKSKLFLNFNKFGIDDEFIGEYQGINFVLNEIELKNEAGKNSECIFKGIIIKLDLPKNYSTPVIISKKDSIILMHRIKNYTVALLSVFSLALIYSILHGLAGNWYILIIMAIIIVILLLGLVNSYLNAKKLKLSNINKNKILLTSKYSKYFNLYSKDKDEGLYLASNEFLHRLCNIEKVFQSNCIRCAFFNNSLILAMETKKDLFELGDLFRKTYSVNTIYKVYSQINSIYDLIDFLIFYKKIYLT